MRKLLVIIPAYNEAMSIGAVIADLKRTIPNNLHVSFLVIDDGSKDNTARVAKRFGARVVRHVINCGLGAAIKTGLTYAKNKNFEMVITCDADGQHRSKDILTLINILKDNRADVVIGSRMLRSNGMPYTRKIINYLSNIVTYCFYGIWTTDSQSGMRGFNRNAIELIQIKSQRMEVSSEIFKEVKRWNFRLSEVPIQPVYTSYSLKKGQRVTNAPHVFWKLFLQQFI